MVGMANDEFRALVDDLAARYGGTKKDLAEAIGISPSALSRLGAKAPPPLALCIRLAHATRTSPAKVLRAAGHGEMNDLLVDLYGPAATFQRQPVAAPIVDKRMALWRTLKAADRRTLEYLLSRLVV